MHGLQNIQSGNLDTRHLVLVLFLFKYLLFSVQCIERMFLLISKLAGSMLTLYETELKKTQEELHS